jgi:hypothetical protein
MLDHELVKVESFYKSRMSDVERRASDLRDQLRELGEHRRIFHELHPDGQPPEWEVAMQKIPGGRQLLNNATNLAPRNNVHLRIPFVHSGDDSEGSGKGRANGINGKVLQEDQEESLRVAMAHDRDRRSYEPERYQKYRKELKDAVLEFYRELEILKNYRVRAIEYSVCDIVSHQLEILNFTGFRKALKKYEKTTKVIVIWFR